MLKLLTQTLGTQPVSMRGETSAYMAVTLYICSLKDIRAPGVQGNKTQKPSSLGNPILSYFPNWGGL